MQVGIDLYAFVNTRTLPLKSRIDQRVNFGTEVTVTDDKAAFNRD